VPSKKIQVISHGVEERFFTPIPDQALQEFRSRRGLEQPYILFVGERRPHKNLIGLIRAFKDFQQLTARTHQLVIAGKPYPGYQAPEREAQPLGKQVRFIDQIMDAELPSLFQASEAFVLLSYYEGFGLPILEAMASGVPVVASNYTCLPEVVSSAGLLVSPDEPKQAAEALAQVIRGGKERDRLIALGKEHASRFTWQSCARITLATYRQAVVH
jgi:glycosyltransferase involved in cell wall biosynthesis